MIRWAQTIFTAEVARGGRKNSRFQYHRSGHTDQDYDNVDDRAKDMKKLTVQGRQIAQTNFGV